MTQETVANSLHQKAIALAEKWSDHYGKASVGGRLMAEDLFSFANGLINRIEGYEQEVKSLRNTVNERDDEILVLKEERDELIDTGDEIRRACEKVSAQRYRAHRIFQAVEHIIALK